MTIFALAVAANSVWKWIHRLGGPGLVLLGIADNTPFVSAPPGSVDVIVILLAAHRPGWWPYYALMVALGEVLGGYLTYRLAEKGGQQTLEKKVGKERAEEFYKLFAKHGFITVLIGSILPPPFPFTSVVMTAGVMQYPRRRFFSALTMGRTARYLAVACLGSIYGRQVIVFFSHYYRPLLYILIALGVMAGVGTLIYFKWYRPRAHREHRRRMDQSKSFSAPAGTGETTAPGRGR